MKLPRDTSTQTYQYLKYIFTRYNLFKFASL